MPDNISEIEPDDDDVVLAAIDLVSQSNWSIEAAARVLNRSPEWLHARIDAVIAADAAMHSPSTNPSPSRS